MLINSIVLENFRCYHGRSEISFNTNGKITLIYGNSGEGKSSLLQFFRWMFYGDPDFGQNDDRKLFNESVFYDCNINECFDVFGQINFEHLGTKYSLIKKQTYKTAINIAATRCVNEEYYLQVLIDNNWNAIYDKDDICREINKIMPHGLSKYFLLDGERARETVLNSQDLKRAIHQLFGLDAYANAINHITGERDPNTVLGKYTREMTSKMSNIKGTATQSIDELQVAAQDLHEEIQQHIDEKVKKENRVVSLNNRRDILIRILGEQEHKEDVQQIIKSNKVAINHSNEKILSLQKQIGDLFYKSYPYLFLGEMARKSTVVLREKNKEFASKYKNVFEHLKKELLQEIKEKNKCVCGRLLDDASLNEIKGLMSVMLPASFDYHFGQFISKSKTQIYVAEHQISDYDKLITNIAATHKEISNYESSIREKEQELLKYDKSNELAKEFQEIKDELSILNTEIAHLNNVIAGKRVRADQYDRLLTKATSDNDISLKYTPKINFFKDLKQLLEQEKLLKENEVKETLNVCVRDIFKQLTTQSLDSADTIRFIQDDFSLRSTYLTGGQLAIDVYSYVLGILKALRNCNLETNENPIIVDAPFAFTDNTQSEHIFRTLPTVSKQTILLTLDLNKINNLLEDAELFDFYVIENEKGTKAKIIRGNIDDFKF